MIAGVAEHLAAAALAGDAAAVMQVGVAVGRGQLAPDGRWCPFAGKIPMKVGRKVALCDKNDSNLKGQRSVWGHIGLTQVKVSMESTRANLKVKGQCR